MANEKVSDTGGSADDEMGPEVPHKPADDREEVYYQGSPLLRGELGRVFGWGLMGLVAVVIPILAWSYQWRFWPGLWLSLIFWVGGVLLALWPSILTKTIRYRISNYRIDYERGLLTKRIDTLELWHVEDITFNQSLMDRVMRVGTITIISNDDTTPQLLLHSVPNPRPLFEALKQRVIAVKRQRGVIKMDLG